MEKLGPGIPPPASVAGTVLRAYPTTPRQPVIDFHDRTVFITGAGSGIGRMTALKLRDLGARIGIVDIDLEAATATAEEMGGGSHAQAVRVDISDPSDVGDGIAQLIGALDVPNAVVNNAGVVSWGALDTITNADLQRSMAVNVGGAINVVTSLLPHFRANGGGRVVNVSSWLGLRSRPMFGLYSASKAALVSLTRTMALELAGDGIAVNAVLPGVIADTPMRQETDAVARAANLPTSAERADTIPLGRLGRPEDVANAIAFLCSDAAAYITGDTLAVDGGLGEASA
jgi:NAD(P)-dependent dehydrogenase (short-subunit alcohol dehydrogenase family)